MSNTVIEQMPKYESYKDSGVEWLGEIPSHWSIVPLKYKLKFHTGGTPSSGNSSFYDGDLPWVTISDLDGRLTGKTHFISPAGVRSANIRVTPKNSLLYSFKLSIGQVAFSHVDLYTNEAIASFLPDEGVNLYYYYYALPIFLEHNAEVNIYGAKLLNQERICNAIIPNISKKEQDDIAKFLDKKTAQIDEVIAIKQKQIELLKERKQIIIQQAVTQGLNPDVPMKDSGVDWIGEIPEHWEVRRSKFLFTQRKEKAWKDDVQLSATQKFGVIPQDEYEARTGARVVKIQFHLDKRKHVEKDDFVISMRSFQGGLERAWSRGCIRSSYVILRPLEPIEPNFYGYLLKLPMYIKALQRTASFIRDGQDLNFDNFSQVDLFVPPLEEQKAIADYVRGFMESSDEGICLMEEQIAKLKEYKTTLINSAVTGKIKVTELV
ncbi:restriction endonuclease subunit S [Photobacterium damselae]|nr:restriction endonuclease subunit S [Photobacterium damselae]